ncbi:MAG: RNA-binding protein, partial [Planctomycetota bacterium]|nr:RNA-binding protein [Planctomycetota bacterium]
MKRIYVGNLSFSWGEEEVRELFATYGEVYKVDLINDRATGRPRGFGFVEMDAEAADAAIDALNGEEHGGRVLRINEAFAKGRGGDGPSPAPSAPADAGGDDA